MAAPQPTALTCAAGVDGATPAARRQRNARRPATLEERFQIRPASAQVLVLEEEKRRTSQTSASGGHFVGHQWASRAWGRPLGLQGLAQPVVTSAFAFGGEAAR